MTSFSYAIKTAILLFPIVALLFTIPYIIYQYHKYGAVSSYRSIIVYSFLLYLMVAYFLVILPLPDIETVSMMKTPSYNLIPFHFISEIFSLSTFSVSDFATYFPTLKNPVVYEAVFNVFLTVPFGVYLHYYFEFDFKKTLFYSFCLTLFFELTQLSGLYFIYPRGYRVFDVDDLILNTLGGVIGYLLAFIPLKFLPTRKEIDQSSLVKGQKVSILRRAFSFGIDMGIFLFVFFSVLYFTHQFLTSWKIVSLCFLVFWTVFYFVVLPTCLKGRTVAMKFFHLEFFSSKKVTWYRIFAYYFWGVFFYVCIPVLLLFGGFYFYQSKMITENIWEYYQIVLTALTLMVYLIALLKRIFDMPLLSEKIAHLKIVSTIEMTKEES